METPMPTSAARQAIGRADVVMEIITKAKGGSLRDGQVKMARYVAASITDGLPLLVQGGTGVGKSLAYLAGAIASKKKVVVAPHTIALQRQLMEDIDLLQQVNPELMEAGITDRPLVACDLQGRSNYICLAKVEAPEEDEGAALPELDFDSGTVKEQGPSSALGKEVVALRKWAGETSTGNRSDLPFPVTRKAWDQVSVTADNCAGSNCPFKDDCFSTQARNRAQTADIIITNQAMLAMSMKMPFLLPEGVEAVVVDEAHEFPSVLAGIFGARVTVPRLRNIIKEAKKKIPSNDGLVAALAAAAESVDALEAAAPLPKTQDRALAGEPKVIDALEGVLGKFDKVSKHAETMPQRDDQETSAREITMRMFQNIGNDLAVLLTGTTDTQVTWVEPENGKAVFRAAQFDVGSTIHELLVDPRRSVVYTSATLAVNQSFAIPAKQLGVIDENGDDLLPWLGRVVESPFDYEQQSMMHFPDGMPSPTPKRGRDGRGGNEEYLAAVADVAARTARAAGGRTLMLCTSRASVTFISERLQAELGDEFPILTQQVGDPAGPLAKEFAANPKAVLVGTRTFWTGVSTPGDSCIAVVLDKLPFPSPGDPIIAARSEKADRRRRGAGFAEVFVPEACLTVVQGVGRLIRTVSDRGVVVVCDPRLNMRSEHKKPYARTILNSLPPFRRANSEQEALEFLESINATAHDPSGPVEVEIDEAEDVA